ncbi:MAG: hypothetical protein ACKOYN_07955 [Planctomycetota bacterium]
MEPSTQPSTAWSITKAEFDGWATKLGRGWMAAQIVLPLLFVAIGGILVALLASSALFVGIMALMMAVTAAQVMRQVRQTRRLKAKAEVIWQTDGAVCPHCLDVLSETPCGHGLTMADAAEVRALWEAGVRGDMSGAARSSALLAKRSRARSLLARLNALRQRSFMAIMNPEKPLWKRLAGAVLGFGLSMAAFMLAMEWAMSEQPPSVARVVLNALQYGCGFGGMMIAMVAWTGVGAVRNRCKACGHIVSVGRELAPCNECGADLSKAGAVVSGERRRDGRTAAIGASIAVAAMFLPVVLHASLISRVLPMGALMLQYRLGSASTRFAVVEEISTRTIDATETRAIADMLIDSARTEPGSALADSAFIGRAALAGTVPEETVARAVRASIAIALEAPDRAKAGEPFRVRVVPQFGTDLFQLTHVPVMALGGIEADGQRFGVAESWQFRSLNGRRRGGEQAREPVSTLVTVASKGEHRLRIRAWVVLVPSGVRHPEKPSFSIAGELIPPAGSSVHELVAETTVIAE